MRLYLDECHHDHVSGLQNPAAGPSLEAMRVVSHGFRSHNKCIGRAIYETTTVLSCHLRCSDSYLGSILELVINARHVGDHDKPAVVACKYAQSYLSTIGC